jgi:NAD(P)-dependent dehydrogenase (short-subunit alcohol dehydrogenase family)
MAQEQGVAVVTGGSRGIGAATCIKIATLGYAVAVNYREQRVKADAVVKAITEKGGRAIAIQGDVATEEGVLHLFAETDRTLGRVTALVNNAGVMPAEARVDEMNWEALADLWRTNVTSAVICSREAVLRMSNKNGGQGGSIVNVSSISGRRGGRERRSHYAASKAAINGFTVGMATELIAEGIRCNAVCPGITATEFHEAYGGMERITRIGSTLPIGRAATAEDVANSIAFLVSDESSYITGILVEIAGGLI